MKNFSAFQAFFGLLLLATLFSCETKITDELDEHFEQEQVNNSQFTAEDDDTNNDIQALVVSTPPSDCELAAFRPDIVELADSLAKQFPAQYQPVTLSPIVCAPEYGSKCVIGFFHDGELLTETPSVKHLERSPNSSVNGSNTTWHRMLLGIDSICYLYETVEWEWYPYTNAGLTDSTDFSVPLGNGQSFAISLPFSSRENYFLEFHPWTPTVIKGQGVPDFRSNREWIQMVAHIEGVHHSDLWFEMDTVANVAHPHAQTATMAGVITPIKQVTVSPSGNVNTEHIVLGVRADGTTGVWAANGIDDYDPVGFEHHLTQPVVVEIDGELFYFHMPWKSGKTYRRLIVL